MDTEGYAIGLFFEGARDTCLIFFVMITDELRVSELLTTYHRHIICFRSIQFQSEKNYHKVSRS